MPFPIEGTRQLLMQAAEKFADVPLLARTHNQPASPTTFGKELRVYRDAEVSGADPGQADWLFGLDYDGAGKRIATGSYRGEVRLWSTETGKLIKAFQNQPRAN